MTSNTKILVTGAHGFVGARAMERYRNAVPVPAGLTRNPGDALSDFVKRHHPDVILNAAAISDIGVCEKNPDASYTANVTLPVVLARAAEATGAKLLSFSSDQVYTGCLHDGPYAEDIPLPEPANVYARHKLEAEARTLDLSPSAVLLRATWMYDMPMADHANRGNFWVNTLRSLLYGTPLVHSSGEYRGITYVRQVVALLDNAADLPGGVYNYGSENHLSMHDTAKAMLDALGIRADVQDTAAKKHDLRMDCGKLRKYGIVFDTTEEGFRRCAADYGMGR